MSKRRSGPSRTSPSVPRQMNEGEEETAMRSITNSRLQIMSLPFPLDTIHVYESSYRERTLRAPTEENAEEAQTIQLHVDIKHRIHLRPESGAIRLLVTATATNTLFEVNAQLGVLLVMGRAIERQEEELLAVLCTIGVNTAYNAARSELVTLTRNGVLGPLMLDPALLHVTFSDPSSEPELAAARATQARPTAKRSDGDAVESSRAKR